MQRGFETASVENQATAQKGLKNQALDKVIKSSQNQPSLLITDRQREQSNLSAKFFKNSQPISVGV